MYVLAQTKDWLQLIMHDLEQSLVLLLHSLTIVNELDSGLHHLYLACFVKNLSPEQRLAETSL